MVKLKNDSDVTVYTMVFVHVVQLGNLFYVYLHNNSDDCSLLFSWTDKMSVCLSVCHTYHREIFWWCNHVHDMCACNYCILSIMVTLGTTKSGCYREVTC